MSPTLWGIISLTLLLLLGGCVKPNEFDLCKDRAYEAGAHYQFIAGSTDGSEGSQCNLRLIRDSYERG